MEHRTQTDHEKDILQRAAKVLPQGSLGNLNYDLIVNRGIGSHIWDESGNEYIDYLLGSGPMIVGHANSSVMEAVLNQLSSGTTFFATNEKAVELAEEIVRAVPCADKVRFCSTGSEATLYAMRAARSFTKKDKILKFEGGFHGMNDYALMSMSPSKLLDYPQAEPDTAGIPKSLQSEMLIAPFNDLETTSAIIDRYSDELAGVIVEPFQRLLVPKQGFLEGLREITSHYEIPLIFDEVVTGFRFSYGGAQDYYGVVPDICTLGKAIAGGFPLTAVAGRDEIMTHFDSDKVGKEGFMPHIGTLNGNPVACAAGLATLDILKQDGVYDGIFDTGRKVMEGLQNILDNSEIPGKVVGEPILFDVFFTTEEVYDYRSTLKADSQRFSRFNQLLLERGVLKGSPKFYFSTEHDDKDVERTLAAFGEVIDIMRLE
ncbi:MAG: aminotransferase class III-fold pyridoxal phosphate-dependent enzyme [SAR202 cluster bacterium]|nr:aminotransferase class III-fold pyridoxal phosphate-dependent enzyme [SAR202 cluster bacterium]